MKKLLIVVLDSLFVILCNVFHCNYRHLDSVYQEELPASPELVRQTKMYKRLRRFVKMALVFKKFELILEHYEYMPTSVSRCIWNVVRDDTRYILFNNEIYNEIVLGKWSRDNRFIKVASIQIEKEAINDEEGDEKFLLLISANYNNFVVGEASSLEEAHKVLAELPERIVVSESNGFDTDDYYLWKKNVVIVESK